MARAAGRQVLRGHVPAAAAGLTSIGHLPASQRLNLAIGLPLRNRAALTNLLQQLYEPASPQFHLYLTPAQFTEKFGPTEQDYRALIEFAETNGFTITATHPNRVLLDVAASVGDLEKALHLKLLLYPHPKEARTFYAPDAEPSLDLDVPVLDISGLDSFSPPHPASLHPVPARKPGSVTLNGGSGPGGSYIGNDFRAAYAPGVSLTGTGQIVGLVQFDGYYASDITAYESLAGLPNVPLQNVLLDGVTGGAGVNNSEVALDIEMVISMAPGLSNVLVYEGTTPNDILNRMATDNLASQLSSSWTWAPFSPTTDQIFQQFAAQGQCYFNASGDNDAYASTIDKPADDPYIVSVGGTTLTTTGPGGAWVSETVWNWGSGTGTGGGISTSYTIPGWQQGVAMAASQGSTLMRNIPDVAMVADNIYVRYNNGSSGAFGGTSCATPLWAAFTALINQQAAANGLNRVGFLNPAIYALGQAPGYASALHDVVIGNNTSITSPSRFYAVSGYDLCTGWGAPAGSGLIDALAGLPAPSIVTNSLTLTLETCTNGAVDPGETVSVDIGLKNVGGSATANLLATLQTSGGVTAPSGPQLYGALAAGGIASRAFAFTASGVCGASITATVQLQDGLTNLGNVSFNIPLGQVVSLTNFSATFDAVTAPALPAGWATAPVTGVETDWTTVTNAFDTTPNAAFIADADTPGENALVSPPIAITSGTAQLTFRHNYNLEMHARKGAATYFDGGVLEIQLGGGGFTDILTAGGSFLAGGYNGEISTGSDNPLGGRQAWVGDSGGWITTTVGMPATAAGQSIQLRWACATDTANTYGGVGWYVDSLSVSDSIAVCCASTVIGPPSISLQPSNQVALAGSAVSFSATTTNTPPLLYQWLFNGSPLPGQTGAILTLTNVQPAQSGSYAVNVTNASGSATSPAANLRVLVPPVLRTQWGTGFQVSLSSVAGLNYTVEYKNSLNDPAWTPLSASLIGTGGTLVFQDTNSLPAARFYRARCD